MATNTNGLHNRRQFIWNTTRFAGLTLLSASGIQALSSCSNTPDESKSRERIAQAKAAKKLGIALVGLGQYASDQLAPALKETQHCYLAGIVTGTPEKAKDWSAKYDIPAANVYNYANFDSIKDNPDIDIIYIVLPNALHAEYVVRAAKAGKHVICEKPMAVTVEECDQMIAACQQADRMLSIGYRLHFEPYNLEMMRLGQQKILGNIKTIKALDGMSSVDGWRIDKALAGGGPLMDVGIYCVQGTRYVTGMEPIAVTAKFEQKTQPDKFKTVEEAISWQLEYPGNMKADCKCSYTEDMNTLRFDAERGWAELSPAYAYKGIQGKTSLTDKLDFPQVNQQARQMDDFAQAVKNKQPSRVPGEMGRQDVKILQAIYKAAETGSRVEIPVT